MNGNIKTPEYVVELARKLRQNMTPAEKILWERINKKELGGHRFRRQHPIHRYILDFYCHSKMLAVEIDGPVHDDRVEYDQYRDEVLKSTGIETLRFSNHKIENAIEEVIESIRKKLSER